MEDSEENMSKLCNKSFPRRGYSKNGVTKAPLKAKHTNRQGLLAPWAPTGGGLPQGLVPFMYPFTVAASGSAYGCICKKVPPKASANILH